MLTPDHIIRTKRKTLCLTLTPQGELIVRAPLRASQTSILAFVASKQAWITLHQEALRRQAREHPPHQFVEGENFLVLGRYYPLQYVPGESAAVLTDTALLVGCASADSPKKLEVFYRQLAKSVLTEELALLCAAHSFSYSSMRVNGAKGRYGSCGAKNSLNFSWRLAMAPREVIRSVAVHELCHTVHHNHSSNFWALVFRVMPEYEQCRAWLQQHQQELLRL